MAKVSQTPGNALKALIKKHGLNTNRLAKAIGMSTTMVNLISRDQSPVSVKAAMRLSKFFKTKPEYWLDLQMAYEVAQAAKDKALAADLKNITDVAHYEFVRKAHKPRARKAGAKKAGAKKRGPAKKAGAKRAGAKRGRKKR